MATTSTRAEVYYPDSDGKPMAESPIHREVMTDLIAGLKDRYVDDHLVYVSGNMFLYFVEGQPRRNVSPDVMVVRGIDKGRDRKSYKSWEEGGKLPDLVIEVTSGSTRREDIKDKFRLYRDELKIREYFLFDPLGDYLDPPLQGFRLVDGVYHAIDLEAGRLPSEVVALHFEADGRELRLHDPATARRLPTRLEKIEAEKEARLRAIAKLRRSNAELRREKAVIQEKEAVIQEKEAVIQEKEAVIQEKEAALHESQGEIERLRRELESLRGGQDPRPKPKKRK